MKLLLILALKENGPPEKVSVSVSPPGSGAGDPVNFIV